MLDSTYDTNENLFRGDQHCTMMSGNSKELIAKHRQDGASTATRGEINKIITGSWADELGLGRWNWMQIQHNEKNVRIIAACQCVKSTQTQNAVYQQQLRCFKNENRQGCPREFFRQDLSNFIQESISQEFAIILSIDGNENMSDRKMQRSLQSEGLIELSSLFSNDRPLASHTSGSKQIDAVWETPIINPTNLSILLHHFAVGDHRCFIVDFPMYSFMGDSFIPIVTPEMRRLTLSNKGAVERCLSRAESLLDHHKTDKKNWEIKGELGQQWSESKEKGVE